jgi:hypothetical protein
MPHSSATIPLRPPATPPADAQPVEHLQTVRESPTEPARGYTPNELARVLRVSPDRIRAWIVSGELPALNTASARCGRPRYVVLPTQLDAFIRGRQAAAPKPAVRRRRRPAAMDYFPD